MKSGLHQVYLVKAHHARNNCNLQFRYLHISKGEASHVISSGETQRPHSAIVMMMMMMITQYLVISYTVLNAYHTDSHG